MNKKILIILGITILLLIPLTGCVDELSEDNKPNNSIVGLWKRESDSLHEQYYINGTRQIFTEYNNYSGGDYYSYTYKNNILTKYYDSVSSEIWDIEWLDSDTFTETSRDTGAINTFKRVASVPN